MTEKKTALITGATSGIGAAFARKLSLQGYDLIITGRRKDMITNLAREISVNSHVEVIIAELSSRDGVETVARRIREAEVDVLINNAGHGNKGCFLEFLDGSNQDQYLPD